MFFELIAVFVAGFAGAGLMMVLRHMTGGRLARWMTPVGAGAAMLLTTISSEYSWFSRTANALPEGIEVIQTVENRALYRPWTYAKPYVNRFAALDTDAIRVNGDDPALRLVDLYLYGRWAPVQAVQVKVNCATGQRADPGDSTSDTIWRDAPPDDPILRATCQKA